MISVTYLRVLIKEFGLNESAINLLVQGTDLTEEKIQAIDGKFSSDELIAMIENITQVFGESSIGLMLGAKLDFSSHGLLGLVLMTSPTLKMMLEAYVRYVNVSAQFLDAKIKITPEYYILEEDCLFTDLKIRRFLFDMIFSSAQCMVDQAIGRSFTEGIFKFAHPEPEYSEQYSSILHSTSQFSCDKYQICIPIALGDLPSLYADESLLNSAKLLCEQHLKEQKDPVSTVSKVKKFLYDNPGRIWTSSDIAKEFNISLRTLARKLEEEKTSYKEIREESQKEMVIQYLVHDKLSVEKVAYLMGYTDTSNFRRSFKRWFGMTASEYIEMTSLQ